MHFAIDKWEKYNLTPGIAVYDDRVEIENPGRLPVGITPENIKHSHASFPYNPLIAEVLYRSSFLESWGSGVSRMVDACRVQGVPEPEYEVNGGFVTIVFRRPDDSEMDQKDTRNVPEGTKQSLSSHQVEGLSRDQVGTRLGLSWDQVEKLLACTIQAVSAADIRMVMNMTNATKFKRKYINPLLEMGVLQMTQPDAPKSPTQKYYLTELGRKLLGGSEN